MGKQKWVVQWWLWICFLFVTKCIIKMLIKQKIINILGNTFLRWIFYTVVKIHFYCNISNLRGWFVYSLRPKNWNLEFKNTCSKLVKFHLPNPICRFLICEKVFSCSLSVNWLLPLFMVQKRGFPCSWSRKGVSSVHDPQKGFPLFRVRKMIVSPVQDPLKVCFSCSGSVKGLFLLFRVR